MESFLFNLCKYLYLRGRSYKALRKFIKLYPIEHEKNIGRGSISAWPWSPPPSLCPPEALLEYRKIMRAILFGGRMEDIRILILRCLEDPRGLLSFEPRGPWGRLCLVPLENYASHIPRALPPHPINIFRVLFPRKNIRASDVSYSPNSLPEKIPLVPPSPHVFHPSPLPLRLPGRGNMRRKGRVSNQSIYEIDPTRYPLLSTFSMPPTLPSPQNFSVQLRAAVSVTLGRSKASLPNPPTIEAPPLNSANYSSVLRALRTALARGSSEDIPSKEVSEGKKKTFRRKTPLKQRLLSPGYRPPDLFSGSPGQTSVLTTTVPSLRERRMGRWGRSVLGALDVDTQMGHTTPESGKFFSGDGRHIVLASEAREAVEALRRAGTGKEAEKGVVNELRNLHRDYPSSSLFSGWKRPPKPSPSAMSAMPGLESWGGEWGGGKFMRGGLQGSAPSLVAAQRTLQYKTQESLDTLEALLNAVDRKALPCLDSLSLSSGVAEGKRRRELLDAVKSTVASVEKARWG